MNFFHSFNSESFTSNLEHYRTEASIVPDSFDKVTFTPLGVTCVLRRNKLTESDIELFENEIQIDRLTSHPNLVKMLFHFLNPDGSWYSVFPYSPYSSLGELCKPFGLPESVIAFVLLDILKAVDYLHQNNIVHSAIKGSHILMFGNLKSSVKFVLTGLKYSYQMTESDLQSFDYPKNSSKILKCMAPEILEQNIIGYDFKADIYSIGILCCELANGIIPFDYMPTDQLLFYKIIQGDTPRPLDSTCGEIQIIKEYTDRMEQSLVRRYMVYVKRKFTEQFHEFIKNGCLPIEQARRLSASKLLAHDFMKSILEKFRSNKMSLLDKYLYKKD